MSTIRVVVIRFHQDLEVLGRSWVTVKGHRRVASHHDEPSARIVEL